MVPLSLTLKNFLCYRGDVPTLDFRGIHLACLSGRNGHGKSALLDAITWALWGKARGRSDDGLICQGTDEMRVELDFKVRDDCYRVARRRTKPSGRGRSGSSDLQLQISNGDEYTPITRNSLRETESEIRKIIGMDYDTFINSAFLMQGRADEFTNRTPSQRKEVLGKLIGLEEYDSLQDKAKERARAKGGEVLQAEGRLQHIQQQLARKPALQHEQQTVAEQLALLEGQLKAKQAEVNAVRVRFEGLRANKIALRELQQESARITRELEHHRHQAEAHQQRIDRCQAVIASREAIELGMQQLEGLRVRHDRMNEARTVHDQLRKRESDLSLTIAQEHSRLEEQAAGLVKRVQHELEPTAEAVPMLQQSLKTAHSHLAHVKTEIDSLDAKAATLTSLTGNIGRLDAELKALETEGKELGDKLKLLEGSGSATACPLCGTGLGPDQCRHLAKVYNVEIARKRQMYAGTRGDRDSVSKEKVAVEGELSTLSVLQQKRDQAQRTLVLLEGELSQAAQAAEQLVLTRGQLAGLQVRLESRDYAPQEQAGLRVVQGELTTLGYNAEAHQELYRQVQEAQSVEEKFHNLRQAEESLPQEMEALAMVQRMIDGAVEALDARRLKAEATEEAVRELPCLEEELTRHIAAEEGLQRTYRSLLQQQGAVEGDLRHLESMEAGVHGERQALLAAQEAQGLYQELEAAFGKQGVQAMLIDTLLPRVEETANELLARMTDGRMHVKLETQRERRSGQGGAIETLDITISDELGSRAYEMFSGGEAFRINLALRIALSKELARRRGAPLPTLFIDEGFGTQDAPGRDRILDVISAIEYDFEKIFVITHLEDLKDAFPVQIQVEKDGRGASAWIE